MKFDPNAPACPNGNFFAFPYTCEQADLILMSAPWDVSTSYRPGTAQGPQAILEASPQLDFWDMDVDQAWTKGIATDGQSLDSVSRANELRAKAEIVIDALERSKPVDTELIEQVNMGCRMFLDELKSRSIYWLSQGKKVGIVGGDHSVALANLEAYSQWHESFGVLHIDAHADLRPAYEGFEYSHASIFYNALKLPSLSRLVSVGVRDFCEQEMSLVRSQPGRIHAFLDDQMQRQMMQGRSWAQIVTEIISQLPQKVYVSLDIDGLDPANCPNTGTPVPGGLTYVQCTYLLTAIRESGREIIGFDLCEVAPGADEWDANVGARLLYKLSVLTA